MLGRIGFLCGVALAALANSPSMADETSRLAPKLSIMDVDPMSPLTSATRGVSIVDPRTTGAVDRSQTQFALASVAESDDVTQEPSPGVDLSLSTGPQANGELAQAELAPVPTPRPKAAATRTAQPAVARGSARKARVVLASDEIPQRPKRVFRYPGPILVGAYN